MPNVSYESETRNRECPGCAVRMLANRSNFYYTPSTGRLGRCLDCHTAYYANRAAARRSGGHSARTTSTRTLVGTDRRFGVEIEYIGTNYAVCTAMRNAGLECEVEGYNHTTRAHWKIVTDASVQGGYELVSPVLHGDDGREQIRKACAALQSAGARVNRTTGIHVHHDVRDFTVADVIKGATFYHAARPVINTLVAASRRNTNWAKDFTSNDFAHFNRCTTIREMARIDRYKAFNVAAYAQHGTIEFRQHQGSLNANKILGWIEFGQAILTFAKSNVDGMESYTFDTMSALLVLAGGLTIETANYLRERTVALNATTEDASYAMVS